MPRPTQIPDLERQLANIITRVETLERKRPDFGPPAPTASGAITSHLHTVGTERSYGTAAYTVPMTEEFRCGDEDVSLTSSTVFTVNTDGIYALAFHAFCQGYADTTLAVGWRVRISITSATLAAASFYGPELDLPLVDRTAVAVMFGVATLSWVGRLEATDHFSMAVDTYDESGPSGFSFYDLNGWVTRLGDCP